jgi:hypothetical protein
LSLRLAPPTLRKRGRPRKFLAPSRAVTLTLPEDVIAALEAVDHDLSRAIVGVAQPEMAQLPRPAAKVASFDNHLFESIRGLLRDVRRSTSVSLRRRQIMVIEHIDGKGKRKQLDISYSRWRNGGNA